MLTEGCFISSSDMIVEACKKKGIYEVTNAYVKEHMHMLGLKHMKAKHIPDRGNAKKSLVLR